MANPVLSRSRLPRPLLLGVALALVVATHASAQTLVVLDDVVTPGRTVRFAFTNGPVGLLVDRDLLYLHRARSGELVTPQLVGCWSVGDVIPPGARLTLSLELPADVAPGSYLVRMPFGAGAATRLDVGARDPRFPQLHGYLASLHETQTAHSLAIRPDRAWEFVNTGTTPHTFGPNDTIELFSPGASTALASTSLAGQVAPPGVSRWLVPQPPSIPGGTAEVRATWTEPTTGRAETVSHGLESAMPTRMALDLHLPGGADVPFGGRVPVRFAARSDGAPLPTTLDYALLAGFQPGITALGGGSVVLPLVANDPLVLASIANGLGGVLGNHVGTTHTVSVFCAHRSVAIPVADDLAVVHPSVPAAIGASVRIAAIAWDASTGRIATSQSERITFR